VNTGRVGAKLVAGDRQRIGVNRQGDRQLKTNRRQERTMRNWLDRSFLFSVSFGAIGFLLTTENRAIAQLIPISDITPQGNLSTIVLPSNNPRVDLIDGGTRPQNGVNLFHSFSQFNIDVGRGAYFVNPDGVRNILSRVTGNSFSDIRGTVGVLGTANLFLINPNGIIFRENAALDMQGSFVATTANAIRLRDTGFFSASQPEASNLLTIDPSAFFFNVLQPQPIINQSFVGVAFSTGQFTQGLQVKTGQNLLLVGGDIAISRGILQAPGGRVELGGLSAPGIITLNPINFRLNFPGDVEKANTEIFRSIVNVTSEGGGNIAIHAKNLTLSEGGSLFAGIAEGLGTANTQAGNIDINATGKVIIDGLNNTATSTSSFGILNEVRPGARGNAGNINISAGSLTVSNGAKVQSALNPASNSLPAAQGNTGNINLAVQDAIIVDRGSNNQPTQINTGAASGSIGDGGNITITAGKLIIQSGAAVSTNNQGQGRSGAITIDASDSVEVRDRSSDGLEYSNLTADSFFGETSGDLTIRTGRLIVSGGARVSTAAYQQGQGGNLTINSTESVDLIGPMSVAPGQLTSGLLSSTASTKAGGNLTITTKRLNLRNGAQISTSTASDGQSGNLDINASEAIELDGETKSLALNKVLGSSILNASLGNLGNGGTGNISLSTQRLTIRGGGTISGQTDSRGRGSNIAVKATESIELVGTTTDGAFRSTVQSQTTGDGAAGDIAIITKQLLIKDGQISTISFGKGQAGSLTINASGSIYLSGSNARRFSISGIYADTSGSGTGGNINITTTKLTTQDETQVAARTLGSGRGGNLILNASESVELNGSAALPGSGGLLTNSSSGVGDAGNLTITTKRLSIRDGALVSSGTGFGENPTGEGKGGDLTINASEFVELGGVSPSFLSTLTSSRGRAGNLTINTERLSVRDGAAITTGTIGEGNAGNLTINNAKLFELTNSRLGANTSGAGNAGNLTINTEQLNVRDGSLVQGYFILNSSLSVFRLKPARR
jgi:filamentous hemagglutinin family protein